MNVIQYYRSTAKPPDAPVVLPFISTWNTANTSAGSSDANQVKLPLISIGTYDFIVDWGDGSIDTITAWNQPQVTHTYSSTGTYTITITGNALGWKFNNGGDRLKILNVSSWGNGFIYQNEIAGQGSYFGCSNLNFTATDKPVFESSPSGFFRNCSALIGNSSINEWTFTNPGAMSFFFAGATNFNQNISGWNVSSILNFQGMFQSATAFNQNIGAWDVSNASNLRAMFQSATSFNQNIGSWNVSNATDLSDMFRSANAFNQNIGSWNVGNVTNFSLMFLLAPNFNQNIGGWNVVNAINMQQMFQSATAFNQNIGSWNVSKVGNFSNFMAGKTAANFSAANLDAIYNGWSARTFTNTSLVINFNTIKYTAAGSAGRATLTGSPNNWIITDGGI